MQDINSEISSTLPFDTEEVLINCCQSHHNQQQHQQQQERLQQPYNNKATTANTPYQSKQQVQQQQQHQQEDQKHISNQQHQQLRQQQQQQQQIPISLQPISKLFNTQKSAKVITRSQSSKVIQDIPTNNNLTINRSWHQFKQQQSLPTPLHSNGINNITNNNNSNSNSNSNCSSIPNGNNNNSNNNQQNHSKSVSILVYKTLNTVFKSSRKIIVRVCEVAGVKKNFTMFKFNKAAQERRSEARLNSCTGHDQFVRPPVSDKKAKHIMKKLNKQNGLKRSNSAIEFDASALTAANRRNIYSDRSMSSEHDNSDQSEHTEKSPLVSAKLDNLARLFFSKSMPTETGSRDTIDSILTTRPNIKCQYSALDNGNNIVERSPRERAHRERALNAIQEWIQNTNNRYDVIAHLDEIGSRHGKNWFLVTDATVRTDRLLSLLTLPPDCVAFEEFEPTENPKNLLTELLGSLHHPYIYPVLDLGFLRTTNGNYACLVTPFNSKGSLKDLIYKAQWNEPWSRKYTRKPNGLPVTQIQRLGRQILEALLFLKERGFPLHGHLHSGNVILQNGAARLTGLENGLLGLSSRINAVMWSRSVNDIENVDIICFGHLIYEMCMGQEMTASKPSIKALEMELEHYPQILDVLALIFDPPNGICPSVEDLVLCDLFRSIDLRELRGPCFNAIKPNLSQSTLNLLQAVKKRHCATLGTSLSADNSPCTPPSTPNDYKSGQTREYFDYISSESEEGLLDEIVVGCNYHQQQWQLLQCYHHHQHRHHYNHHHYKAQQQQQEQQGQQCHQQNSQKYHYHSYPHLTQKTLYETVIESPIIQYCCSNATQLNDEKNVDVICSNDNFIRNSIEQQQQNQKSTTDHQQQGNKEPAQQKQIPIQSIMCCGSSTSSTSNLNLKLYNISCTRLGSGCSMSFDVNSTTMTDSIHSSESSTSVATTTANTVISHDDVDNNQLLQQQQQLLQKQQLSQSEKQLQQGQHLQPLQKTTITYQLSDTEKENIKTKDNINYSASGSTNYHSHTSALTTAVVTFNHQLSADICNFKNSKSRRLEYSLKCLKYGKSNPSQDSAFGSLTDNDLSTGSSSFRLSSFQSASSPINEEGVEDVIIATTTAGQETCLELATLSCNMVSQDSAISSPCRESSPNNFIQTDGDGSSSGTSSSSGSMGNLRPQHFPVSLSPKILVTATTNSSNSSLASSMGIPPSTQQSSQQQQQIFDPPKILVNDQNSIYTTSPSKRSGTVEVFSQKYRVSSFEDMLPNKNGSNSDKHHLKNVNRLAFRSLEEERRIDNAFIPIIDRTHSENRVNVQSEKYKKLTHTSFRISKTSDHDVPGQLTTTPSRPSSRLTNNDDVVSSCNNNSSDIVILEMHRTSTVCGSANTRQTMWRDSKFYRKNRIAKSNDSLLDTSPNHSARLSPSSLRDNHYESSSSSYGSHSKSKQSLNRGGSITEIIGSNQMLGLTPEITVTTSFCDNASNIINRRYCSSKSEDLEDTSGYLRVMDTRKSYSERHLVTLTTLKQTAINNTNNKTINCNETCCLSEDNVSTCGKDNNASLSNITHRSVSQCSETQQSSYQQQQQQQHQRQMRHYRKNHQSNKEQQMAKFALHDYQLKHYTNQLYQKRSHPNQFSWSSNSINRLRMTNIKTTSLATLNCQQQQQHQQPKQHHHSSTNSVNTTYNLQQYKKIPRTMTAILTSPQHQYASTNNITIRNEKKAIVANTLSPTAQQANNKSRSPKRSQTHSRSSSAAFTTFDNTTDTSTSDNSNGSSINITLSECNYSSSPDESPSGRTLSGLELAKIFSMNDETTNNSCCCSEEKTPLLDSVEMSPISPIQTDRDCISNNGQIEDKSNNKTT